MDDAVEELSEETNGSSESKLSPETPTKKLFWPPAGAITPGQRSPLDNYPRVRAGFTWYIEYVTEKDTPIYRSHGGNAFPEGRGEGTFYQFFPPKEPMEFLRDQFSLPKTWNDMDKVDEVIVPPGTKVYIGPASSQQGEGYSYRGGGIQLWIPKSK